MFGKTDVYKPAAALLALFAALWCAACTLGEIPEALDTKNNSSAGPSGGGLSAPTGVNAEIEVDTLVISWNPVNNAMYYYVYASDSLSGYYEYLAFTYSTSYSISYSSISSYGVSPGDTFYFKVSAVGYNGDESGLSSSYGSVTVPSSLPPPGIGGTTSLTNGAWVNGSLTSMTTEQWYTFTVTSGNRYYVWLNDSDYSPPNSWMDCKMEIRYNSKTGSVINYDNTDTTNYNFNASQNSTVYVRVSPLSGSGTGSYQIAYSTSSSRPSSY